jgi:hypothetical protein
MQLQALPADLPAAVRRWAEELRELAEATGEPTAGALAERLHCAPATLSRYLQGQRPRAALASIVPKLVALAGERTPHTWTMANLAALCERATATSAGTPDDGGRAVEPAGHRARRTVPVLVALAVAALLGAGIYLLWGVPDSRQPAVPAAPSDNPAPKVQPPDRRCALVTAKTSPVWTNLGDAEPLKWKAEHERVRLLDLPIEATANGTFQAVYVPHGSPTGIGWMPADDLEPTPCPRKP